MNQATSDFRNKIADSFIKVLSEKQLQWKAGWQSGMPVNAYTGKSYKGINKFGLYFAGLQKAEEGAAADNRWATFKQIQDKGWRLRKGAKGEKVEYWQPYDFNAKKPMDWMDFYARKREKGVSLIARYYTVFNGSDIEGIPELKKNSVAALTDELINKISSAIEVPIFNDGGIRAYYSPVEDAIHLPEKASFLSAYEYNATALHELSHASGAEKRLNRNIRNTFGSEAYAYEELVAEISACFMGEYLTITMTEEHMENHKAYVQSWIEVIREKPDQLIHAIRDAETAANYLEYHAGLLTREEYLKTTTDSLEVPVNMIKGMDTEKTGEKPNRGFSEQIENIERELRVNGYKPTPSLLNRINSFNKAAGKVHSLKEIHSAYDRREYINNPAADKLLNSIGKCLQNQDLLHTQTIIR